jgi:hypothetical protein
MASSGGSAPKKKVSARKGPTANMLGYRVNTLVLYKNNPYHIVAIGSRGDTVTIKKCTKSTTIRDDVPLNKVTMVDSKDPLYARWGLIQQKPEWGRTREDELYIIKALVDSTLYCGKEARRDVLIDVLKRHMWLGVWLRACYGAERVYRLKPSHLKYAEGKRRNPNPDSIFMLLTQLQFNKLKPKKAVIEWVSMLETMDEFVWDVANMILLNKLGSITYSDARYAMIQTKCIPVLPKREA